MMDYVFFTNNMIVSFIHGLEVKGEDVTHQAFVSIKTMGKTYSIYEGKEWEIISCGGMHKTYQFKRAIKETLEEALEVQKKQFFKDKKVLSLYLLFIVWCNLKFKKRWRDQFYS